MVYAVSSEQVDMLQLGLISPRSLRYPGWWVVHQNGSGWCSECPICVEERMDNVATNLLGQSVCWTGVDGYMEGQIVAVAMDQRHGDIVIGVHCSDGKFRQKELRSVTVK